jgi:ubiquinone/menaquinone biosynthesis C-methylase UbiE
VNRIALGKAELRDLYRERAPHYDLTSRLYRVFGYALDRYRERGVHALELRPGDRVVDLGCGTGASFAEIERAIGPTGSIIGVDLSKEMLDRARARVRREGLSNVRLVESDVDRFLFPARVDAILSTYALTLVPTYDDVIRRGAAALAPGRRFAIVDLKAPIGLSEKALRAILPLVRPFGVTLGLRDRHPWESMSRYLRLVTMEQLYAGTTYLAVGEKPDDGEDRARRGTGEPEREGRDPSAPHATDATDATGGGGRGGGAARGVVIPLRPGVEARRGRARRGG